MGLWLIGSAPMLTLMRNRSACSRTGMTDRRSATTNRPEPQPPLTCLPLGWATSPAKIPIRSIPEEVCHTTRISRRTELLSRSCLSGVEAILNETHVKRGRRVVHGEKELNEKLGRNDLCPCGSGRVFKRCCRNSGFFRRG